MKRYERARMRRKIKRVDVHNMVTMVYAAIISVILLLIAVIRNPAYAASHYPVQQLGGCKNAKECELYCQLPAHMPACWSYGKNVLNKKKATPAVAYPIPELGNCASADGCFAFCSQPTNEALCSSYARSHKLLMPQEIETPTIPAKTLSAAADMLGCDSQLSCMTLCDQPSFATKCKEFANTYFKQKVFSSFNQKALSSKILVAAKASLGCDSAGSCLDLCNVEANQNACTKFGIEIGFLPPQPTLIPTINPTTAAGGCATDAQCNSYCASHPNECPGFSQATEKSKLGYYLGPAGCKNQAECKAYCDIHTDQCPGYATTASKNTQPLSAEALMKDKVTFVLRAAGL